MRDHEDGTVVGLWVPGEVLMLPLSPPAESNDLDEFVMESLADVNARYAERSVSVSLWPPAESNDPDEFVMESLAGVKEPTELENMQLLMNAANMVPRTIVLRYNEAKDVVFGKWVVEGSLPSPR